MARITGASRRGTVAAAIVLLLVAACGHERAEPLHIAVATNFARPLAALVSRFEEQAGARVVISSGSSGKLFAQILHGAPYDILLSADQQRPRQLVEAGQAVRGSRITYAIGQLVLWHREVGYVSAADCALVGLPFRRIAIANPELAPYGRAAREALQSAGSWEQLQERIVFGENVGQAFAQVATGNADAGLLAKAYVVSLGGQDAGSYCDVPSTLHAEILQDAVLLQHGAAAPAAAAFMEFLQSAPAKQLIAAAGYGVK